MAVRGHQHDGGATEDLAQSLHLFPPSSRISSGPATFFTGLDVDRRRRPPQDLLSLTGNHRCGSVCFYSRLHPSNGNDTFSDSALELQTIPHRVLDRAW